ncbi:hypothetical protein BDF22DRAFT_652694 [Syncephalis plumigaleata]|nr:hypothetical protein BDF22DRAFT_652694 [Syncephalis plumigaleata]
MTSSDLVLLPQFTKTVLSQLATSTPGVDGIIDWDARLSGETFISDSVSCVSAPRSVASSDGQSVFNRKRRMSSPSVLTYPTSSSSSNVSPTNKPLSLRRNASQLRSLRGNRRCHSTLTTVLPPSPTQLPTSYEENEENDSDSSDVSVSDYASTRPTSGTERTLTSYDNDSSAQSDASSSVPVRRWLSRANSVSATSLQSNLEVELSRQIAEQKKLREQLASLQNQLQAERAVTRRKMYQDFQEAPEAQMSSAPLPVPAVHRARKASQASVTSLCTSYSTDTLVNDRMTSRMNVTSRSAAACSASPPLSPKNINVNNNNNHVTSNNMVMNGAIYTEVSLPAIPAQRILVRRASQAQPSAGSPPRSNGFVQPTVAPAARPVYRRKMSLPLALDTTRCPPNGYRVKLSPRQSARMPSPPLPQMPSPTGKTVFCARPVHPNMMGREEQVPCIPAHYVQTTVVSSRQSTAAPMPSLVPIKTQRVSGSQAAIPVEHSNPAFNAYRMRKVVRRSTVSNGSTSPRTSDDSDRDLRRVACQPRPVIVRRDEQTSCYPAGFNSSRRRHSMATHNTPAMIAVRPTMTRKMSMAELPSQHDMYMMRPSSPDTSCDESFDMDTSSPLTTPSLSQDSDDSIAYQLRPVQPSAQRKMIERIMGDVLANHRRSVNTSAYTACNQQQEEPITSVQLTSRGAQSRVRSNAQAVKAPSSFKGKERGVWSRPSVSISSALAPSSSSSSSPSTSSNLPCADSLWQSAIGPVSQRYSRPSVSKILRNSSSFDALYAARAEAPWLFVPSAIDEVDDSASEISSISATSSPVYDSTVRMCFTAGSPNSRQATQSM